MSSLQRMFEYAVFVLAPHFDARLDLVVSLVVGILLLAIFAALVAMPRRVRVSTILPRPVATARRIDARIPELRGRGVRPTAQPRAPAWAV